MGTEKHSEAAKSLYFRNQYGLYVGAIALRLMVMFLVGLDLLKLRLDIVKIKKTQELLRPCEPRPWSEL